MKITINPRAMNVDQWEINMNLSIVVPTYNKVERLEIMLKSLYLQKYTDGKFEVVIIDDGTDETLAMSVKGLQNIYPFRYFYTENKGRAYARNCGIEMARYKTIVFVDDDVVLSPDFMYTHGRAQKKVPQIIHGEIKHFIYSYVFKDPVRGILYAHEERLQKKESYVNFLIEKCKALSVPGDFENLYKKSIYMNLEKKIKKIFEQNDDAMKWVSFTGGNVSCPVKWLEEVNGFDEKFGTKWGCEDLELGYRLKKAGRVFGYMQGAAVCHINHEKKNAVAEHKVSAEYFISKYNDDSIIDIINFLSCNMNGKK